MSTTKTVLNINPKVFVGLLCGLGAAALGGILAYVTPETFAGLGPYEPAAFSIFSVLVGSGSAWLKREEAIEAATEATPAPAIPAPLVASPVTAEPTAPTAFDALIAAATAAPAAPAPAPATVYPDGITITHAASV